MTAPPHEARGHQTLSAYIQARFDEFSRSQKDVAQYIVDHLDEVAFQTAEELARRANTSSSTVVRFSQALGFEGFPELQHSAREEYRRKVATGQVGGHGRRRRPSRCSRSTRTSSRPRSPPTTSNVEETARRVSRSEVEAAIDAIAGADRVLVVRHRPDGVLRLLLPPPADAARPARRDRRVAVAGGAVAPGPHRRGHAGHRPERRPPAPARRPRDEARPPPQGAGTLAVIDATLSEVAKLAQIKLYYSSNSPAYVRSHTALLSQLQALAYGVYSRDADQYADRIKAFRLK